MRRNFYLSFYFLVFLGRTKGKPGNRRINRNYGAWEEYNMGG
jgi:hypothetical protein